jgi:bifunctional non-homologous end joining protein LigD
VSTRRTTGSAELERYEAKRNFGLTPEPKGVRGRRVKALSFVIQKHWASRLHYDFRLELDGVLLSWAVPKGPSFDPKAKRMAVRVEDHPVAYGGFEGTIPPKQYGAGTVIVWDRGTWEPVGDAKQGLAEGKLVFDLHGEKLAGRWELVNIAKGGEKQEPWILFKKKDGWARPLADYDVITALPDSVLTHPLGLREAREPLPNVGAPSPAGEEPDLSKARRAKLPESLAPQLATLATTPPTGPGWSFEPKWDGYRILARIDAGQVKLFTRNGQDWSARLRPLARAIESLGIDSGWLDGEIVIQGKEGAPDFNALQNAMDASRSQGVVYFAFDLPFLDGRDLRAVPLASRRALLRRLCEASPSERVRFSPDFDAPAEQMLEAACAMQLEGVIAKRSDAPYVSARTESWLKLKCGRRQEFVVVGFTDRANANGEVGSLLLAYHEGGELRHAGNVGTGWDRETAVQLHRTLSRLRRDQPAVDPATVKPGRWSRRAAGAEHWVEPTLVVEVAFGEWTPDKRLRHASFKGVRSDKSAQEIGLEAPVPAPSPKRRKASAAALKITHPERVIDPSTGLTKIDLVRYYESVAERMLPHLAGRPVALVRAPQGIGGPLFFQKHPESRMPGLKVLDATLWPGHAALLEVDTADALLAAAQMNVVEFHTWNSQARRIDLPDRMIFDLDPGEGLKWSHLQEAATLMRAMLEALGLKGWLKTSGGKGLHVVVPLAPRRDYALVKGVSQAIVQHMARSLPQKFVAKAGGANRVGKVFIDYLRNGHGQTTAAAFSARARPGMGVSMPVSWDQLGSLKSGAQWTVATAREYLSFQTEDPWAAYASTRQTLNAAIQALGCDEGAARPPARKRAAPK